MHETTTLLLQSVAVQQERFFSLYEYGNLVVAFCAAVCICLYCVVMRPKLFEWQTNRWMLICFTLVFFEGVGKFL